MRIVTKESWESRLREQVFTWTLYDEVRPIRADSENPKEMLVLRKFENTVTERVQIGTWLFLDTDLSNCERLALKKAVVDTNSKTSWADKQLANRTIEKSILQALGRT